MPSEKSTRTPRARCRRYPSQSARPANSSARAANPVSRAGPTSAPNPKKVRAPGTSDAVAQCTAHKALHVAPAPSILALPSMIVVVVILVVSVFMGNTIDGTLAFTLVVTLGLQLSAHVLIHVGGFDGCAAELIVFHDR